jgi:hypothetical protein
MNRKSRRITLLAVVIFLLILLFAFMGTGIVDLIEGDELFDGAEDFSMTASMPPAWTKVSIHHLPILFHWGIAIFALFAVYIGGRSKARRFNDRTIDLIHSFKYAFTKTAFPIYGKAVLVLYSSSNLPRSIRALPSNIKS